MNVRRSGMSRRGFLRRGSTAALSALAAPYAITSSALGQAGRPAASGRINLGFVGVGGRGGALLNNFLALPQSQVRVVCEVKQPRREWAQKFARSKPGGSDCAACVDFREVCGRNDLDAVVVATTDHWHVMASLEAVRSGKDVYCEKPLGLSVEQGQVLREAIHRYGRVFQFGTQERSTWQTRFACEMVRSGRIGKLRTIKVGSRYSVASGNYPESPVPADIDYDLWLGPAPYAPYCPQRVVSNHWFHISDYALGFIAGCGIHTVDMAQWGHGTDLTGPVEVEGAGVFPTDGLCNCATAWNVNLTFAGGVVMNFTDGEQNPLGVKFEGDDGWVFVKERHLGGTVDASDKESLRRPIGPDEVHLAASAHHQGNFLEAVATRGPTIAPIEVAVKSDQLCQLSDIAMRLGRKLRWDPDKEIFPGDEQANRMLHRPMREPWRL